MVFDEFVRPWRQTRAFTFNLRADIESLCIKKFIYCLKKKTNLLPRRWKLVGNSTDLVLIDLSSLLIYTNALPSILNSQLYLLPKGKTECELDF